MAQYLYIFSNPSMSGVIKVGRTDKSPQRRVSELHTTGVPTAFDIELSLEVEDGRKCEKAAHKALEQYRLAANREFFRIEPQAAIEKILSAIGSYKIRDVKDSYGIQKIEREIERREKECQRQELERRKRLTDHRDRFKSLIAREERELRELGQRPIKEELPGILLLCWFAYFPIPFGWLVWLGTVGILDSDTRLIGLFCIGGLVCGHFAHKKQDEIDQEYEKRIEPFSKRERRIRDLEEELASMEKTPLVQAPVINLCRGEIQVMFQQA